MEGRNGVRRWTKKKEDERRRRRIERRKISAAPSVTRGNLQLDKVVGWTPWAPIVGYTRARVSPRATFPGNGRVIPRVTQVPSATEGEIAQRKNSGADLRLSLSALRLRRWISIRPSISTISVPIPAVKNGECYQQQPRREKGKERRCIAEGTLSSLGGMRWCGTLFFRFITRQWKRTRF